MTLEQLFEKLSLGELSNLSLGVDGTGAIEERHQPKILNHVNEGLLRLYSRFILCEKEVLIEQVEAVTNYHLVKRFAESVWDKNSTPVPYIKDLPDEPFSDDVIKILAVFDSLGRKLPLNDSENPDSLFTPQAKVLQVPRVVPGVCLSITYQAKHPVLTLDKLEQELDLPEVLEAALTSFIAWKVYSGMNTQESTIKAQEHHTNYESVCNEAVANDLVSTSTSTTNVKFDSRGWV